MLLGLFGFKIGMTRTFNEKGDNVPLSVIDVSNNYVLNIKNSIINDYIDIYIAFLKQRKFNKIKNILIFNNINFKFKKFFLIKKYIIHKDIFNKIKIKIGDNLKINIFENNYKVDIRGISIGKGFSGVIKKYHFSSGDATHGNSLSHRSPGSIGMCQDPGRVFKGKRMPGRLGGKYCTIQNLKVYRIDYKRNLLFILGSVPGSKFNKLSITFSIKHYKI